ncbi:MAG: hypothetical protein AAF170_04310 [Bacteroidota bacterium]
MSELPPDLDGLLTDAERGRFEQLARNAEIRRRFEALRAEGRTVSAALVALRQDEGGPGYTLSVDQLRKVIYGRGERGERPWLSAA